MANLNMGEVLQLHGWNRGLDMNERPTQPQQADGEVTDELLVDAPTLDDARDVEGEDPRFDAIPRKASFEHRRLIGNARRKLFGRGQPAQIGRYRIERRLGVGGMGEVYLAHDDDLDRKVAIKRVLGTSVSERDQERLRREARALARLSHANVVQVYEVGEHEQRTFVAMEFVDGQTASVWLAEQPRPWRAVLEHFLAAGRGLAAAHEAGLVHRDFKPDNVLLSADGSVRVADFGLALAGEERRPLVSDDPGQCLSADMRMSLTGAILGTIRYMPLEQLRGEQVDARSDQFSFCVALYEALWGTPPFSVVSSFERLDELERGVPTPPSARGSSRPPAQLWRVIRRGLSKDPEARWPDMGSLLEALDGVTRRRRRRAWIGSVSAALTLAAGALVLTREPAVDPCAAVERELEGTWDNQRRTALERGLANLTSSGSVEAGHAAESRERVLAGLDRWSSGWARERERVCLAGAELRVDPELGRLQSACLTRQRQQVRDLVELLLEPGGSADALAAAVEAVAELPAASACEDELALLGVKPPPLAITDEVEGLRREVVRAQELRLLGRVDEGLTLAEQTERAARGLGYGPLVAEALGELAKAELAAGSLERGTERMQAAIDEAERHHHDHLAADLWTDLSLRTLIELDDAEAGASQLRRAEVANDRVEASTRAQARVAFAQGQLAELRGDAVRAELGYRSAIAKAEDDEVAPDLPSYLSNLARLVAARDLTQAIALARSAVEAAEHTYGPQHPQTATLLYDLAVTLLRSEPDSEEVVELLERAAQIWTQSHGRAHRDLAKAELLLGKLALQRRDLDDAEAHARALASIQAESLPRYHRDRGATAQLLAAIYGIRGDNEEALVQARVALAVWEPNYGLDNPGVLQLHSHVASLLLALGRLDEAGEELEALHPRVQGSEEFVAICLQRSELALRRGQIRLANAELAALDELEPNSLGGHELSYALLRALIAHRRGDLQPAMLTRLHHARTSTPFTPGQIDAWIDSLDLDATERSKLGFSLAGADTAAGTSQH